MRESMGGVWLIGIVMSFVALFAAFIVYAISYTRAFNVKNQIINLIERSEGWTSSENGDSSFVGKSLKELNEITDDESVEFLAYRYIKASGYNTEALSNLNCGTGVTEGEHHNHAAFGRSMAGGYCVTMYCPEKTEVPGQSGIYTGTDSKVYYKVTTFITLEFLDLVMTIPVTGETRTLYYDQGDPNLKGENCFVK